MVNNYQLAVKYFEEKNYKAARDILLELKEKNKDNTDILYFLAVLRSKMGEYEAAIPLYKEVVELKNDHIEAYYNLALCLQNQNKNEEALENYQKVIELNPFLSEAHNNVAVIYKSQKRYEEAEKALRMAVKVKPDNQNAMSNLSSLTIDKNKSKEFREASELFERKEFEAAKNILIKLLEKNPDNIEVLYSTGIICFNLNEFEKGSECFLKVIEINDNHAEAHYSLAVCYQNLDNNDLALKHYKKALELNPAYVDAYNNLGLLYSSLKKYDEAEECYLSALKHKPDYFNSIINLGALSLHKDDFDTALEFFNKALTISNNEKSNERKSVAYSNIGFVNLRRKKIDEAIKHFNIGIELSPDSVLAHYNKAEALLIKGEFEEGWKEYEWRQGRKDFGKRKFNKAFKPELDLANKKILVYAEQGLGDAIQFIRYLPLLKEKGCYIILECGKELHNLLHGFNSIDEIIERNHFETPDIEYDYEVPLLSLPLYFNTTLENIPAKVPYLSVDKGLVEKWSELIKDKNKLKIGIVWAGSPIHTNDRHRSVKLQQFLPLLSVEGTHFYSMQKGFPVIQVKDYQLLLTNLDEHIKSFADTSAIIENLDLVITVDTSVAHLAGALGKETWLLLPYLPDWRWLLEGIRSPWYPTMKLYRQPEICDWNFVFTELKKDLTDFVKGKQNKESKNNIARSFITFEKVINDLSNRNMNVNGFSYELNKEIFDKVNLEKNSDILNLGYESKLPGHFNIENKNINKTSEKFYYESNGRSYDLVIANNVLQYNLAPFHTLTEIKRILNERGSAVIVVPSINNLNADNTEIFNLNPFAVWRKLITRAGLKIAEDFQTKDDKHYVFICKNSDVQTETLYLGLTSGENFGWGVCSKYLKQELSKKINIINIDENESLFKNGKTDGTVFHALNNNDFSSLHPVRGEKNIGYTFFEYELNNEAVKNAVNYDIILGGSTWNQQKLKERGIEKTGMLIQGIDPELFYPGEREKNNDLFIIFSGGKFELRKGQDLVLKAVKILQQKFPDIILINAWYNMWPHTMNSMSVSKHIKYEYKGDTWKNFMVNLCRINNINGDKVFTLPITPNNKLRDLYLSSDIGLFPNRCEGGTNLVLMEYMACGRPVIASFNSGHKDILTEENSFMLKHMNEFKLYDNDKKLIAGWEEPSIDEIVAKLEYAYYNRETIKQIGKKTGDDMKKYTWEKSAESLLEIVKRIN